MDDNLAIGIPDVKISPCQYMRDFVFQWVFLDLVPPKKIYVIIKPLESK